MDALLCHLDEIENPGAKAFDLNDQAIFVVRQGEQVWAYVNNCPHRGIRLEWQPDQFLDYEKQYIQCSTHGALFTLESGKCIVGPCNGKSLQQIECRVVEGEIWAVHAV